jgi:hypothetical protein
MQKGKLFILIQKCWIKPAPPPGDGCGIDGWVLYNVCKISYFVLRKKRNDRGGIRAILSWMYFSCIAANSLMSSYRIEFLRNI